MKCHPTTIGCDLRVGVGSLLAAEGGDDVDEPPVVLDPPLGAAGLLLFLLLGLHLGGLTPDLTGTSQGSVDLKQSRDTFCMTC